MKIERVSYKKLVSTGNFSNVQIGAEAIVTEKDETPLDALTNLQYWVHTRLEAIGANIEERQQAQNEIYDLQTKQAGLEKDISRLQSLREKLATVLLRHGVDTSDLNEIPF